ncbi:tetratricopeptide repeat protein [Blastococcus sp. MG754426]|uniref:tetratricopeptide repeat protein n=1 Tax=unclassified Blastococcus TaxID=2619396 RepID=UPI001EF13C8C|nr:MULTISPECIES: tetratricopeptide repeat protein [unclassified Blastococcus]MCF6506865.1 tetratricopeptide repeat protein [Blastococcus sp. MG754426]MCF6511665.1 tetratricopeptide repeat protein [Blastococcus sp. MG754427]
MIEPWIADWRRLRGALLGVRRAIAARAVADLDRETAALRDVAADPVFATLQTDSALNPEERGRLIATYVATLTGKALAQYPQRDQRGTAVLRDWLRIVSDGLTSGQLAAETMAAGTAADEAALAEQRIEYRLWLGGSRPSPASRAAIHVLYTTVTAGLHADLHAGGQVGLLGVSAVWEWDGLRQRSDEPARALLALLAFIAPNHPVWIRTLAEAWGPLPAPLRPLIQQPPQLRPMLTDLARRGLLTHRHTSVEVVQVTAAAQEAIRSRLSLTEQKEYASSLLRGLTVGLPSASHDPATWNDWAAWLPHVITLIDHCQTLDVRAGDSAYLLDRAAVYVRDARDDPNQAITLGERARALADHVGRPDPVDYANILGNIAIALRHLGRHSDAVPLMQECARITAAAVGDLHHEHIESLLGLANALAGAGRRSDARTHYEHALDQARRAYAATPEDVQRSMLAEVLNDYASELLDTEPPQPAWRDDAEHAATLLDEARKLLGPGDHGWHQTAINRAMALHQLGDSATAITLLHDTITYCEDAFGRYTYPTFGAVIALLDLYEDTDDPRQTDLRAEAHDIDDHLAAPAQDRPAEPERRSPNWRP